MSDPRPHLASVSEKPKGPRILLAEDDAALRSLLASFLGEHGYQVCVATSGRELFDRVAEELGGNVNRFEAIVSDVRMPGLNAIDVLAQLRGITTRVPVILMTAFGDQATHRRAERLGVLAVLDKPFDLDELQGLLHEILSKPWHAPAARQCAGLGSSGGPSGSPDAAEPSAFP